TNPSRRRNRLRSPDFDRRPPFGLDRRAVGRKVSFATPPRPSRIWLCCRPALLEEVPVSAPAAAVAGGTQRKRTANPAGRRTSRAKICFLRGARLRTERDGNPGQRLSRGSVRRSLLQSAARGPVRCGGQLRAGRRHLLLRFDEYRTEGGFRLRSRSHRIVARRAALLPGGTGIDARRRDFVKGPASTGQRS